MRCAAPLVLLLGACAPAPDVAEHGESGSGGGTDTTGATSSTGPIGTSSSTDGGDVTSTNASDGESSGGGTTGEEPPPTRYDAVRQKSAHNSYQRDEAPIDQLVYHRIRSLELDIHVGKSFEPTLPGTWYVYHTDVIDDDTWCVRLDDCLDALTAYTRAVPQHEVLTLWIDLKDGWDDAHDPDALDQRLRAHFGDALVEPSSLREGCDAASVQAALLDARCGWPSLEALRGRVIVALTGGATALRTYHDAPARAAFVAPAVVDVAAASQWPDTAIVNLGVEDLEAAATLVDAGYVARLWGIEDAATWQAAVAAGIHHLGVDAVDAEQDPWARTHDQHGWPFACRDTCEAAPPAEAIVGLAVDSGDLWNDADSAIFAAIDRSRGPEGSWSAFVSTRNSHIEPFAKGCLMARSDDDDAAPYFAVCRPADDEPLRVQWRALAGGTTAAIEHAITTPNTLDPPAAAFVRLRIDEQGRCATGEGSSDGVAWIEIGSACFDAPLVLQGPAASAHGGGAVRLLFGALRLDDVPLTSADLPPPRAWGGASGAPFDGPLP
ncbi:MAG: hypothetical protein K1X88_03575 [Nannocystaceae bacterium]|nr:hypothetical protein [Nannocystaceae bacterium]